MEEEDLEALIEKEILAEEEADILATEAIEKKAIIHIQKVTLMAKEIMGATEKIGGTHQEGNFREKRRIITAAITILTENSIKEDLHTRINISKG